MTDKGVPWDTLPEEGRDETREGRGVINGILAGQSRQGRPHPDLWFPSFLSLRPCPPHVSGMKETRL